MDKPARLALIGDLHGSWDDFDVSYFDASDYELLLFTGDIGSGTRDNGVQVARSVGRLAKPALVMPGNNDAKDTPQIASELAHQRGLVQLIKLGSELHGRGLDRASGQVRLCGYSLHPLSFASLASLAGYELTLLAARPFGMGGADLAYPERLQEMFGITSMRESAARLCALIDEAPTKDLIVLSHNGPFGLGAEPTDPWGCDFKPERLDWGDPDLAEALVHARAVGKRVRVVISGHMHLRTRLGNDRTSQLERDGTLYVNPARVPRIYATKDGELHHHVVLELDAEHARAYDVVVRA